MYVLTHGLTIYLYVYSVTYYISICIQSRRDATRAVGVAAAALVDDAFDDDGVVAAGASIARSTTHPG
jgi:hypothetical protein